ncbi:deleted in malignant brain tumors 1 protein-like [Melanotaenia boesemani]|uniref:deleted in malignant brain tumors 1 protein-like n=1 Tax=Melanotaenia boesemani TaxID=1250792 RepID=UPI001C04C6EC|nr:deleted in malignant brain tumors 1 protein-like [Melanotaenia boesemani]
MMSISIQELHLVFLVLTSLLSLPQFTECEKIRLVGPSRCAGRVEIFHADSWGTVCDDHWSFANAEVVCRELNCGIVMEAKKGAFFGQGKNEIWLDDVQCTGNEPSIIKCPHKPFGVNNCGHSEDAGVICSEHMRVVNGSSRCNGRVEVFHNGHWTRVCSSDWGKNEAEVICREAFCGSPIVQSVMPNFGEARGIGGVKATCGGNETSVSECRIQVFKESCTDAVIFCANSKPIRLINGTNHCNGRVEVYYEGQWGTVCDDKWGLQEAAVACREMNCGSALAVKYKAFFGRGHDQVWMDDIECTGHEKSLAECPHKGFGDHDCDHSEDAGVMCSENLRLSNGTDSCSGRVEVFHQGHWRKICKNNWGLREASVLCKELNCGIPKKSQEDFGFGDSTLSGYTSRCQADMNSISQCTFEEQVGGCEGASVACAGNPPIRLVNGTDRCSGRVEVLHDGQWGTVCDDMWDIRDAQVVCRAMDCGTAQTTKALGFFGEGQGDILLDDVNCFGNETSLLHCRRPPFGENNCGHGEDAGVICSSTIRLINGTGQCSGRVEVHHNGHWSPAYNVAFGMNEAKVVCREMDCGDAVKVSGSSDASGDSRGLKISCRGDESSLTQCRLTNYDRSSNDRIQDVHVECSGNVKLTNGLHYCTGIVEFYNNGQWQPICGESWDVNDAMVVCRQLNCGKAHRITTESEHGVVAGEIFSKQVECNGNEFILSQCPLKPFEDKPCNATTVASVVCTGSLEVRLANGKDECSGRVEVRHGETWQTVCDSDWTLSKAKVVCELLECGEPMGAQGGAHFGQGSGSVVATDDGCFQNITSLQQCSVKGYRTAVCGHERDAGALCAAQLRLAGGSSQCSGRVEVYYKGQWGTVCDDDWAMSNADVVCKQLGCGHAVSAPTSAHFGRGSGPIWLDNVECSGQEVALTQCSHPGFGENNCGHGEDAGAICLGALQKPQITISPAAEVNWGQKVEITCTVVTEHMGGTFVLKNTQGSFTKEKFSEHEAATFVFPSADFSLKGTYFCEYHKKLPDQVIYYPQGNTADLAIIVKLDKPSISLSSSHAAVTYSPNEVSVNKGSTFSVICSTYSIYPEGFFYLTNAKTNITEVKDASGHNVFHVANFEFPEIDFKHQGAYVCIYGVNISSHSFCSLSSKSLQITVTSTSSSSVVGGVVSTLVVLLFVLVVGFLVWRKKCRGAGVMVQFTSRSEGAVKPDAEDKSNGAFDVRERRNQLYEGGQDTYSKTDKKTNAGSDDAGNVSEDLPGRVCYELEPLFES